LDRVYPVGTPLDDLDVDLTGSLPNAASFPRPIVDEWVVSAAGYMIADIASPPPGPNPGNVSRTNLAYKHLFEIWLEVQRDDYERAVARSPIERGLLLGETRILDTCFAFVENALTVSGSTTSVTPLTRFIVDPPLVDLGGVTSDASAVTGSVKDRAYEAFTRWNLLDGRLSTLLSNRRTFQQRKLSFGDDALVDLAFERWARMLANDPQNLALDDAAKALGLSDAQRKMLKAAGATDLRTIGQLARTAPEIERYNERLAQLRPLYKADKVKATLPDAVPVRMSTRDIDGLRKTITATFAKADTAGGA
jgi:hypothetical protein